MKTFTPPNRNKLCTFCGAKDHGAITQPSVTCTRHLWSANGTLHDALKEAQAALDVLAGDIEDTYPARAEATADLAMRIRATLAHEVGRICGEPLFDNGKPIGVCAQPFGTEHSHQD